MSENPIHGLLTDFDRRATRTLELERIDLDLSQSEHIFDRSRFLQKHRALLNAMQEWTRESLERTIRETGVSLGTLPL